MLVLSIKLWYSYNKYISLYPVKWGSVPFPTKPNTFSNDWIRVRIGPQNLSGSKKNEVPCQRYGTIKVPACSNAISAEQKRPKSSSSDVSIWAQYCENVKQPSKNPTMINIETICSILLHILITLHIHLMPIIYLLSYQLLASSFELKAEESLSDRLLPVVRLTHIHRSSSPEPMDSPRITYRLKLTLQYIHVHVFKLIVNIDKESVWKFIQRKQKMYQINQFKN